MGTNAQNVPFTGQELRIVLCTHQSTIEYVERIGEFTGTCFEPALYYDTMPYVICTRFLAAFVHYDTAHEPSLLRTCFDVLHSGGKPILNYPMYTRACCVYYDALCWRRICCWYYLIMIST